MSRLPAVLAVGALLAACDVDFTEPATTQPPVLEPAPARLVASVDIHTRDAARFQFHAGLAPGVKDDGAVREVPHDTLWLGGIALTPESVERSGQRSYRWVPAPGILPDPLRLAPPPVQNTAEPPPVRFRAYSRPDADTLVLAPGDALRLNVATLGSESDLLQSTSWTLRLSGPDGTLTSRMEEIPLPPILHVPAAWLEWSIDEEMHATLSVQEISIFDPGDGDYELHLAVTSTVEWVVRWADQPTS